MAMVTFDLEGQIENLRGLKGDLDEHYWSGAADTRAREPLAIAIAQLSQRIVALEDLLRRRGGPCLRVSRLGLDEAHGIERALGVLDTELVLADPLVESELWTRVRAILGAADDIMIAALRGTPQGWQVPDHPRASVVSLSR